MLLKIFVFQVLASYLLAILIYFNRDFGVDIYHFINMYADDVPSLFSKIVLMLVSMFFGHKFFCCFNQNKTILKNMNAVKEKQFKKNVGFSAVMILVICNILLMYGVLGSNFFYREDYHSLLEENGKLMLISKALIFFTIIISYGYSRISTIVKWGVIVFLIILSLNYSSVVSCAYTLGLLLFDTILLRKRNYFRIFLYIAATFVIMMCATYFRGMDEQGIVPYITQFNLDDFLNLSEFSIYYIWPFSIYVSLATLDSYQPILGNTLIMLNPLPGFLAGWEKISDTMIVQPAVPYSTMGIVLATGIEFTIAFYFLLGFAFAYFDKTIVKMLDLKRYILAVCVIVLGCYIIVLHGDWDLRTTMRIVYYCIIFTFFSNKFVDRKKYNHQ